MPTAQFYRINVDNAFPYNIYGGQQDNSSVKIAHREIGSSTIGTRSWTYSAGGESAFLAFDPDHPRYVLGGSYLGTIEVFDSEAKAATDIMAAPIQYLGEDAKDMKYRYNWNAPIIWSKHEPNTFYHAAQYLLRTRDMGKTWEEVSPDLSNNEIEKQGKGGGPYTNEAVGAENYGTISYVAESPHEKGVIWVGTDDGLVQLTKDGGENWQNVTPTGLKECLVNAIDVSPHDPATAYIATTRYKFNDYTPGLYKTTNYGKTWTNISKGIPYGAFTRVIREDDRRKGLLFAGTETGVYISWNDGKDWQALQLNLPVTPINDLMIKHGDVIVATSGRSFWILDDLALLRQYEGKEKAFKIYEPEDVILSNGGSLLNSSSKTIKGTHPLRGVNPASGAVIYYHLPQKSKKTVVLEITDSAGKLVNRYSSQKDSTYQKWAGGPSAKPTISNSKGLNRFVWNLQYPSMNGVPNVYIEAGYGGHKASPGIYTATLKYDGKIEKNTFEIKPNPLYPTTATEYQEYHEFMHSMEKELIGMHDLVNNLWDLRTQIKALLNKMPQEDKYKAIKKEGQALMDKIKSWDDEMVQRKSKAYDDVENFQNKFTANYLFLINATESDIPSVNQPSRDRRAELDSRWKVLKASGLELMDKAIPTYNQLLWEAGIGAVWVK